MVQYYDLDLLFILKKGILDMCLCSSKVAFMDHDNVLGVNSSFKNIFVLSFYNIVVNTFMKVPSN